MHSNEDAHGSELLVGHVPVPVEVPLGVDSVGFVHGDALGSHSRNLNVVERFLVAVEHDPHAVFNDLASISLGQIFPPRVLHQNLAVVCRKTRQKEVSLNFGPIKISHAKENFPSALADTTDDRRAPERVHLHSAPIVVVRDKVVVVAW